MSEHVYILFRNNRQSGLNEVAGVTVKEPTMRDYLDEETNECRSAQQWPIDYSGNGKSKMIEEITNG